jgi:hypothetical protein
VGGYSEQSLAIEYSCELIARLSYDNDVDRELGRCLVARIAERDARIAELRAGNARIERAA